MSTIFHLYGFRFFYRMFDLTEPCHVHAGSGRKLCKYWIRADGTFVQAFLITLQNQRLKKYKKPLRQIWLQSRHPMKTTVSRLASGPTTTRRKAKPRQRPPVNLQPTLAGVSIDTDTIQFDLSDGRSVKFPLTWSAKLSSATPEQRQNFTFTPYNAFWDDVDEIIGVENVLYGDKLYL